MDYRPTRRDWQYLETLQELIAESGRITNAGIGTKLGVSGTAVAKWRKKPGFEEWVNAQLDRYIDRSRPKVLTRAVELATRGSIDHMNFCAKVGGWFAQRDDGALGEGAGGLNVNILIPRG